MRYKLGMILSPL